MTAQQPQSGRQFQKHGSIEKSKTTSKPKSQKRNQQSRTTKGQRPTGQKRPMDTEQKIVHAIMQFLDRCGVRFRELPLPLRIVVVVALVGGGILVAPYVFGFIINLLMNLCILGILILFLIGMVGTFFGGGWRRKTDPISGMSDEEWDEMTDPRGNGPRSQAPDYW